jgi:hypothetical protein
MQMQSTGGVTMKIRIGDRVRLKREGSWGTVIGFHNWSLWHKISMYLVRLDTGVYVDRTKRQLETLPRYRGYPQARDMKTAMRHLREYMR